MGIVLATVRGGLKHDVLFECHRRIVHVLKRVESAQVCYDHDGHRFIQAVDSDRLRGRVGNRALSLALQIRDLPSFGIARYSGFGSAFRRRSRMYGFRTLTRDGVPSGTYAVHAPRTDALAGYRHRARPSLLRLYGLNPRPSCPQPLKRLLGALNGVPFEMQMVVPLESSRTRDEYN